jgi:hypothetical protein
LATLKLNKPYGFIKDIPIQETLSQFVVMRHARHERSLKFSMAHKSRERAMQEAARLQEESPTERYLVLQVVEAFGA